MKAKAEREKQVLLGLIGLHIDSGKPIGSNTLKENGFDHLSSATIRNYFAKLEKSGLLKQQHSSGGRIPTTEAYRLFANHSLESLDLSERDKTRLVEKLQTKTKSVTQYLQNAAEFLSEFCTGAVVFSAPRFDQDFITDLKLTRIDDRRLLGIIITDFGEVKTEILHIPTKISQFSLKRIESYFHYKITGIDDIKLDKDEIDLAQSLYNELMLRYIVNYTHFSEEDIYRTGFSKLLNYPEFHEATSLASGLALFENKPYLHSLLTNAEKAQELKCYIGEDIESPGAKQIDCSIVLHPYSIQNKIVGAFGIMGPTRVDYPRLFGILKGFCELVSHYLTQTMYENKITYRQPRSKQIDLQTSTGSEGQLPYMSFNRSNE